MNKISISRRDLFRGAGALGALAALERFAPSYALAAPPPQSASGPDVVDLVIARNPFPIGSRIGNAMTINGTIPGPIVRLQQGRDVLLRVTNRMEEDTSIHWHGVLLPFEMDGVPGLSYPGILAGQTFEYRFKVKQYGTYWYHSHTGVQEQSGVYGPIILDPIEPEPFSYDRDYVVMLSDWTFEDPHTVLTNLKKHSDYYNFQKRTAVTWLDDVKDNGLSKTVKNYAMWSQMRMMPTDLLDVTGHTYTYLMNGLAPESNWTGLFKRGEKIRLRFINGSAMTVQDIRIPGLKMTVVAADGQNVQPVEVDELRIGVAEVYDVIVQPQDERAYTIFAETLDRSGYARGTLAPRAGMSAPIPQRRKRPLRTMKDMGMDMMPGMMLHEEGEKPGMKMPAMKAGGKVEHGEESPVPGARPVMHSKDGHGPGNAFIPMKTASRLSEPGIGLGDDGRRVLVYTDLKAVEPFYDQRPPSRELEIHLTGHMERYMWSFDGKKFTEVPHIEFLHGERLRLTLVNDTMMEHPIHLHGMWMNMENGHGAHIPRKHTILVKPAARVSALITADAPGLWAFHCHYLYHMEMGMFRAVRVADVPLEGRDKLPQIPLIKSMMHDETDKPPFKPEVQK
jgi:CopA family copper-resistance protein